MIFRNIYNLARRYPVAVILNFIGLAVAFLVFSLIMLQTNYELSFDKCHPTSGRVFRVDKKGDESIFRNILPRGFAEDIIASSSHIEAGCAIMPFYGEEYFTVEGADKTLTGYKRNLVSVSDKFIDVFGVKMVEGDKNALQTPGSIIIPESLAKSLFPGEPASGKILRLDNTFLLENSIATITGVYEDFPSNTQLDNALYLTIGDFQKGSYGGANFICYLLLDSAAESGTVADEFNSHFDFAKYEGWLTPIELIPLTDIYFRNEGDVYKSGSRGQFLLLIAIALLILFVGLVNFANFYVALTPLRIKSINVQKILGSSNRTLRGRTVGESVLWCFSAFILAAVLLKPVSGILVSDGILMQELSFRRDLGLIVLIALTAIVTGVLSGLWPAYYSTSGESAAILKGAFGNSKSGKKLRSVLVGAQLIISIVLLISIFFIQAQSRFMKDYPCGYDKNNLAVVNIGSNNSLNKSGWLKEQLKGLPEVEDVAFSMELFGGSDVYSTSSTDFGNGNVMLSMIYCTSNFPDVLGLQVLEGRGFNEGSNGELLLSEDTKTQGALMQKYPNLGTDSPVIGFVNKLNITSLRKADSPVALISINTFKQHYIMPYAYIRFKEGFSHSSAIGNVSKVLKEMDGSYPYEILFYDSIGKNLYSGEERLKMAIGLFSLVAMILSLIGIWGQMMMDVYYKKMEIAVKRVFGAEIKTTVYEGILLYMRTVVISYLIAAPAGWITARFYLKRFAHSVGFSPWIFILSFLIVAALAAAVVAFQYFKMAVSNPIDSLKRD